MRPWRTDGFAYRQSLVALLSFVVLIIAADWPSSSSAQSPSPAIAKFLSEKLKRVSDFIRDEIAAGTMPGAVVLIQQHGRPVYFESFGVRDVESRRPMTADTIFRIYSMAKPITSVAAMMLVEDGKLSLDDPIEKYIPAFAGVKVGVEKIDESGKHQLSLEPLRRPVTIKDLLRHTSGLTYGFYGETMVRKLYDSSDIYAGDFDNATFVERLAKLPLADQPGTRWDYGHSTDVLGRIIEVISGQTLYEFEKQRLLDPLGMTETAFFVADDAQRPRIAEPMPHDRFSRPVAGITDSTVRRRWESGGAGMVGTTGDYARFLQMLLNGGTLDGKRYLKPETIALMTTDQIGPETKIIHDPFYFPGETSGFGLGFAVRTAVPVKYPSWVVGEYRWEGAAGTGFFVDPRDDMFAILMVQAPPHGGRLITALRTLVYDAIERKD
jgi:CubicO group peptidase (beta-lactamase class C family)